MSDQHQTVRRLGAAASGEKDSTQRWRRIALDPARSLKFQIVLGVVALVWIAFVGALLLRPHSSPQVVAALPPLLATPPLSEPAPFAAPPPLSYGQVATGTGESPSPSRLPSVRRLRSRQAVSRPEIPR